MRTHCLHLYKSGKNNFFLRSDEHSGKVKSFMLDVLYPLITEADNVSTELLDIILINIVEPNKSQRKNAYQLAKELIKKTHDTLEQYIVLVIFSLEFDALTVPLNEIIFFTFQFFNQVLIIDEVDNTYAISSKIYDLIYELNVICPRILLAVLPQLECKLKSGQESERLSKLILIWFLQLIKSHYISTRLSQSRTFRLKCIT